MAVSLTSRNKEIIMAVKNKKEDKKVEEKEGVMDAKAEVNDVSDAEEPKAEPTPEEKYNELNNRFLRLYAEFENYRKRTNKERLDLITNANADLLKDFEVMRSSLLSNNGELIANGLLDRIMRTINAFGLTHATMDIRYHAGGYEPQTVLPSQQLTLMMEFQAIDAILPAGHGINIVFTDTGEDYLAPACGPSCIVHIIPSLSELSIPHINHDSDNIFITPQSIDAANN